MKKKKGNRNAYRFRRTATRENPVDCYHRCATTWYLCPRFSISFTEARSYRRAFYLNWEKIRNARIIAHALTLLQVPRIVPALWRFFFFKNQKLFLSKIEMNILKAKVCSMTKRDTFIFFLSQQHNWTRSVSNLRQVIFLFSVERV